MSVTGATNAQLIDLTHAYADAVGEAREDVDALPLAQRRRIAFRAALALCKGGGIAAWPADKAGLNLRFEGLDDDGNHWRVERYLIPGQSVPAIPRNGEVFPSTVRVPSNPVTDEQTPFRARQNEIDTVQAGTCTFTLNDSPGAVIRDRLPEGATNVVWTEGPFDVPVRVFAGRDPVKQIIAEGLGEL